MALVSLSEVSLGFGGPLLLEAINLQIERGEWIGLLGRNGMGKSTLLKLVYGELSPDAGAVARQQNLRLAFLPQEVPLGLGGRVGEIVAAGLDPLSSEEEHSDETWQRQIQLDQVISRMQLDADGQFDILSAGMKRRVLLARGLVRSPDLLLLDEPTNHLDIVAINWLEEFLTRWGGTLLFVTHDRMFLQRLATRIIELDRGRLFDWNCNYATFMQRKEAMLAGEAGQDAVFDRRLAQEELWIRKGVEARRTRNEGRVRALHRLREERRLRRLQAGKVRLQIQDIRRSGKLVLEAVGVSYGYEGETGARAVVRDFTTTIQRGDKIGIVGPNGSGKTTLLRLLMGELKPQAGHVRHGTNLDVAYLDQMRAQLDENKSVLDNVGEGRDAVTINGKVRSLVGYLEDFLFERDRLNTPIITLSGGERNRLLLARLFARPANLLVLDEPTNDLDIETLELLEDQLMAYRGTLLLVSHDRTFLNNLVTATLALDGSGRVREYVGGYDDWQSQSRDEAGEEGKGKPRKPAEAPKTRPDAAEAGPRKPSYKEQRALEDQKRELDELPARIQALESEQHQLVADMAAPAFYQQEAGEIARAAARLQELENELAQAYARWEELEQAA